MNSACSDLYEAIRRNSVLEVENIIHSFTDTELRYKILNSNSDNENETILQYAIQANCSLKLIKLLLEYGSTTESETGETALWMAISQNRPIELIILLLEFKADIFVLNEIPDIKDENLNPSENNEMTISNLPVYSLLHLALTVENDEILRVLLNESKLLVNDQRNRLKETPLSTLK